MYYRFYEKYYEKKKHIGIENVNFCLFAGDMILYMENPKDNPNIFRDDKQIQDYRTEIDVQKSIVFFIYISMNNPKIKLGKQFQLQYH